jgi:hypothetical protein
MPIPGDEEHGKQRLNRPLAVVIVLLLVMLVGGLWLATRPTARTATGTPPVVATKAVSAPAVVDSAQKEASVPSNPALTAGHPALAWGPSYYNDGNILAGQHRPELELMKQVDQQMLTGQTWGPSYYNDGTLAGLGFNRAVSPVITWGPSYYADDTHIVAARHRPELELMKQVDQQMLTGQTWGPAYYR